MEATRLRVRVSPGAVRSRVVGRYADGWKIRVAAPAENGRANDAVVRLFAETIGVPRGDVTLVSGHRGRDKIVELAGTSAADVEHRLATAARKDIQ